MAVGAGSIKRAAKAKVEPTEKKKEEAEVTEKKAADAKRTEKAKPKAKKPVAKKEINQVCHLTEDLPVHLL